MRRRTHEGARLPPRHSAHSNRTTNAQRPVRPARSAGASHSALPAEGLRKPIPVARIVVFAALVIALFAVAITVSNCVNSRNTASTTTSSTPAYVSPYDWNNLTMSNQLYTYRANGIVQSKVGIDVSDHQGDIDWASVAADGIQFAYIRAGYRGTTQGSIFEDDNFAENLQGAKAAGLQTGVYFYSQATTEAEAEAEADFVLQALGGAYLEYPVAFDAEPTTGTSRISNLSKDQLAKNAIAFCTEIEKGGYSAIIYGNNKDMGHFDRTQLTAWPIWYAEYGSLPVAQFDFTMWQYSNAGSIDGISTSVDLDIDLTAAYNAAKSQ